jgi:hypothetical protein
VTITLVVTALLFLLNVLFAIARRRKSSAEVASYVAAAVLEFVVFMVVLLFRLGLIKIPFSLPQGLSFNRAEIAAALSLGLGLFPAAYWQGTSLSQLRKRMEDDAKVIKQRDGGVRVRTPGEWIN